MNLNKTILAAFVALGSISMVHAADQGHGKITFTGSIIDAPCSISPESIDQTVELGQISNIALKDGGKSTPKFFSIKLENCSFGDPVTGSLTWLPVPRRWPSSSWMTAVSRRLVRW
ncbi:fimbrial protein [Pseudomonas cerasi]